MGKLENDEIDTDRIEDKYIVSKDFYIEVKAEVRKYMELHFPDPGTVYCINRSLYFDSPDLTFLKQHLLGIDDRRKIRIRAYAPNGKWSDEAFVEVKYKDDGNSRKNRLRIGPGAFDSLYHKSEIPIDDELYQYNSDVDRDDITTQAKLINYLLLINKCKPVVDIYYKRYAYQDGGKLRCTIDQDIKVKPIYIPGKDVVQDIKNQQLWEDFEEVGCKYNNADDFLLEFKYQDEIPDWFEHLTKQVDAEAEPFSKYVWAMYQVIDRARKLQMNVD
jgi:SPX domain protein involved in polyphosphate accumulation